MKFSKDFTINQRFYSKSQCFPRNVVPEQIKPTTIDMKKMIEYMRMKKIVSLAGVSNDGEIQVIHKPVHSTEKAIETFVGNLSDDKNHVGYAYIPVNELGAIPLIEPYESIPQELRPSKPLHEKFFEGTEFAIC